MEKDTTENNSSHTESSTTLTQQSPKNTNSQVTADMKSAERRQEETDGASENPKVKKIRVCSDVGEDPEVSSVNTVETPSQKGETQDRAKSRADFFKTQHDEFNAKYAEFYQYRHEGYGSMFAPRCHGDFPKLPDVKHFPKTFVLHLPKENEKPSPSKVDNLIGAVITREKEAQPVVGLEVQSKDDTDHEEAAKLTIKDLIKAVINYEERNVSLRDIHVKKINVWTDFSGAYHCETDLQCTIEEPHPNRVFTGSRSASTNKNMKSNPEKAPPETFLDCYDARATTVWQLGVVLFEILSNRQTFNTIDFIDGHLTINRVLSKECKDFYQSCLDFFPMERPRLQDLLQHPWFQPSSHSGLPLSTSTLAFSFYSSH
ncbi:uncharacterized protein LOC110017533 isoform X2 [Oryzias latipes]|uniref:uncharacterized protein LOC110017533 isoform X2 n=1 Tax=Oryzias latipes TaxID=8090 RepID=UPI0009DB131B|nr:uncharacterized protein LOC110017533 isoform X2 [Oryzias latipes]